MSRQPFFARSLKLHNFSHVKLTSLHARYSSAEFRYVSNRGYCQLTGAENHLILAQVIAELSLRIGRGFSQKSLVLVVSVF